MISQLSESVVVSVLDRAIIILSRGIGAKLETARRAKPGCLEDRKNNRLCLLHKINTGHVSITISYQYVQRNYPRTRGAQRFRHTRAVRSGGRAVERRTVNRGDGGSIPPTAVSKLRQFRSPQIACVFRKRH